MRRCTPAATTKGCHPGARPASLRELTDGDDDVADGAYAGCGPRPPARTGSVTMLPLAVAGAPVAGSGRGLHGHDGAEPADGALPGRPARSRSRRPERRCVASCAAVVASAAEVRSTARCGRGPCRGRPPAPERRGRSPRAATTAGASGRGEHAVPGALDALVDVAGRGCCDRCDLGRGGGSGEQTLSTRLSSATARCRRNGGSWRIDVVASARRTTARSAASAVRLPGLGP